MDITELQDVIEDCNAILIDLNKTLDIDNKTIKKQDLELKTTSPAFWEDKEESSKVLNELKGITQIISEYNKVQSVLDDAKTLYELYVETSDASINKELENTVKSLQKAIEKLKIESVLSEEYDTLNALITIHAGAGGTESQDWAQMLYRMYSKYLDKSGFSYEVYDIQEGEDAGIKSITFEVKGTYAYGYLKSEKGVHRLVRISPFDAAKRRHTSFASVEVMPAIDDSIQVDIKPEDLEIDTYRASGAGGQHINKTDSAVRIKHIPTGIVTSCQTQRSQMQNKEYALNMLKAKLYQYEMAKAQEKLKEIKGEVMENGWGSQIRSYVFCPYTLVKDHRTGFEVGNVQAVIDGEIDGFINEYLMYNKNK